MILHGHILVNNKPVNVASYMLRPGDVVHICDKSRKLEMIHASLKRMKDNMLPPWLSIDKAALTGTYLNLPERADIPLAANEQLIVELYSK